MGERVEVDRDAIRELEENLALLRERNKEFAKELSRVKDENMELRDYAEKCKLEGERRALEGREDGFARAMAQAASTLGREKNRPREIPYRKPEIYKAGENLFI